MSTPSSAQTTPSVATNAASNASIKTVSEKNSHQTTTKKGSNASETVMIENDSLAILPTRIAYIPTWHIFNPDEKDSIPLEQHADYYHVSSSPYAQLPNGLSQGLPQMVSGVYALRLITKGYVYLYVEGGDWAGFKTDDSANLQKIDLPVKSASNINVGRGGKIIAIRSAEKTPTVWIGYSRTEWTKYILADLVSNPDWRSKLMKSVSAAELGDGSNLEPPATLGFLVDQEAVNLKKYIQEFNRDHKDLTPKAFCYAKTRVSDELVALDALPQQTANDMNRRDNEDCKAYKGAIAVGLIDAFGVAQDISHWRNYNAGRWCNYIALHRREITVAGQLFSFETDANQLKKGSEFHKRFDKRYHRDLVDSTFNKYKNALGNLQGLLYFVRNEWESWTYGDYYKSSLKAYDIHNPTVKQDLVNDVGDAFDGAGWSPENPSDTKENQEQKAIDSMLAEIEGDYKNLKIAMTGEEGAWDKIKDYFTQSNNIATTLGSIDTTVGSYAELSDKIPAIKEFNQWVKNAPNNISMEKAFKTILAIGGRAIAQGKAEACRYIFITAFCARVELAVVREDTTLYTKLSGITQASSEIQKLSSKDSTTQSLANKVNTLLNENDKLTITRNTLQGEYNQVANYRNSNSPARQHEARLRLRNLRKANIELKTNKEALAAALTANDADSFKVVAYMPKEQAEKLSNECKEIFAKEASAKTAIPNTEGTALKTTSASTNEVERGIKAAKTVVEVAPETTKIASTAGVAGGVAIDAEATSVIAQQIGSKITFGNAIGQWFADSKMDVGCSVVSTFMLLYFMCETYEKFKQAEVNGNDNEKNAQLRQMAIAGSALISNISVVASTITKSMAGGAITVSVKVFGAIGSIFGCLSSALVALDTYYQIEDETKKGGDTTALTVVFWSNVVAACAFAVATGALVVATAGNIFLPISISMLIVAGIATFVGVIADFFYQKTSDLELWVNQCYFGIPLKDYPTYSDPDIEAIEFIKALNVIYVDFNWVVVGTGTHADLSLTVLAPRFNPNHSELSFAIFLSDEENSKTVKVYVKPSILNNANKDFILSADELKSYTVYNPNYIGYVDYNQYNHNFIAYVNSEYAEIAFGGDDNDLYKKIDSTIPKYELVLRILKDFEYPKAELELEFHPNVFEMPELVITPDGANSNNLLTTEM
jgi:hypothetical protein